ncbi:MAG: Uncharacterised protein [Synechococcus sp. MIT S9220]|nr:MAG: Uncharacterised protein [Synechococcus sp. MIT S9220]
MLKNLWFEEIDACVDGVAQGFVHLRLFLEGLNASLCITHDNAIAADLFLRNTFGDQAGEGTFLPVTSHRFGEIKVDECIATQHHKGVVEERLEILDFLQPASGAQSVTDQFAIFDTAFEAVSDFHSKSLAISEVVLDLLGQVGHIDHHLRETMLLEQFQQEFHHWLLQDWNHRFGDHMCDRLNPCSLARGQDHRLHRRYRLTTDKPT